MSGSKKGSGYKQGRHSTRGHPIIFLVEGVRHFAIVIAGNEDEAVRFAMNGSDAGASAARVVFGGVQRWEAPETTELKLPEGLRLDFRPRRER